MTEVATSYREMEDIVLRALLGVSSATTRELYALVERSGLLNDVDRRPIPSTAGYKRLRALGHDPDVLSLAEISALTRLHGLPNEPDWQNRVRQALRSLVKSKKARPPYVERVERGVVRLTAVGRGAGRALGPIPGVDLAPDDGDSDEGVVIPIGHGPSHVHASIRRRRGQQQFRRILRERYDNRCVVTGSRILALLEAAHIEPFRESSDHAADNGLLLRADVHTLFDLNLLGIRPEGLTVTLRPELANSWYTRLSDQPLIFDGEGPSIVRLAARWAEFRAAWKAAGH